MVQAVNGVGIVGVDNNLGAYYTPGVPVQLTPDTITFAPDQSVFVGANVQYSATSNSPADFFYTVGAGSDPGACTVSHTGLAHYTGVGLCVINVGQQATDQYAAGQTTVYISVDRGTPTLSFTAPASMSFGDPDAPLTAQTNSDAPVTFTASPATVCTVVSGKLHAVAAGNCAITAQVAQTASFEAVSADSSTVISPGAPTLTFTAPTGLHFGDPDAQLSAVTNSDAPVTFAASPASVCTVVAANKLHMNAAGSCTVTASVAQTSHYAASSVQDTTVVGRQMATVNFTAPDSVNYGDPDVALTATTNSTAPVTFTATPASVCTIVSGKLHVVGAGSCTVTASVAQTANFTAGSAQGIVVIARKAATVNFVAPTGLTYGDANAPLSGTTNSTAPVTFTAAPASVCTIVSGRLHIVSAGSCTVTASVAQTANFTAGSMQAVVIIAQKAPTITFTAPTGLVYGHADVALSATTDSTAHVTFTASPVGICTVVSGKLHIAGAGVCSITAAVAPTVNYLAATVTRTTTIAKALAKLVQSPVSILGSIGHMQVRYLARLTSVVTGAAIPGQTITFSASNSSTGRAACSATTDALGIATCSSPILSIVRIIVSGSTTATYAGNDNYLPTTNTTAYRIA